MRREARLLDQAVRDPALAFTRIAARYDSGFTNSGLGVALRARVWSVLDSTFGPGEHVADLGCGTGEDARHLAERGLVVTALDAAPDMALAARAKTRTVHPGRVDVVVARMDDGLSMFADGALDGAVSSFGALNCVEDLGTLAASLGRTLRPGGHLVLTVMGPVCVSEMFWHLLRLRPSIAFRRLQSGGTDARVGCRSIRVRYPSSRALGRALSRRGFELVTLEGLGLFLPPTQASAWLARHPGTLSAAARADRALGRLPGASAVSDHYVAVFRKRPDKG